jgi:cytochrome c oxidase subunit 4
MTGLPHLYYRVFAALLVLTGLTVAVAFIHLGPLNLVMALAIATSKALLVALFFMHLRSSRQLVWLCTIAGVFWFLVLLSFTLSDYLTRGGSVILSP